MKVLALIPARGGSKRVPGKNVKPLGGLPLIAWSIRSALQSGCCSGVLVSTDDEGIAAVAREHGASVPWLRPAHLATDTASSVDVALHALDAFQSVHGPVEALLLLQPTSPFRSADAIPRALSLFAESKGRHPVVSVSPAQTHPAATYRVKSGFLDPFLGWDVPERSQDQEPAWQANGSIYVISPERLRTERVLPTPDTVPVVMDGPGESIDIDTEQDFDLAEFYLRRWGQPI